MPPDASIRCHAGWYPDGDDPAVDRWWNGTQWTTHTRVARAATDLVDLTGEPPRAWSTASDSRLATVDEPCPAAGISALPDPTDIPAGWHPDPDGLPAQRWWDGSAWTEHTAPPAGPPGPPAVTLVRDRSVGVALALTFFFGPLGMLYSTVSGALIMLAILFVGGFLVFGLAWLLLWPLAWAGSMVWGALAAARSRRVVGYRR